MRPSVWSTPLGELVPRIRPRPWWWRAQRHWHRWGAQSRRWVAQRFALGEPGPPLGSVFEPLPGIRCRVQVYPPAGSHETGAFQVQLPRARVVMLGCAGGPCFAKFLIAKFLAKPFQNPSGQEIARAMRADTQTSCPTPRSFKSFLRRSPNAIEK